MNEKNDQRLLADRTRFEISKNDTLAAMHRLKLLRKSASLVKNSGDEIFLYTVNALAVECERFINIVADINASAAALRRQK